eukprot:gene5253-7301_t
MIGHKSHKSSTAHTAHTHSVSREGHLVGTDIKVYSADGGLVREQKGTKNAVNFCSEFSRFVSIVHFKSSNYALPKEEQVERLVVVKKGQHLELNEESYYDLLLVLGNMTYKERENYKVHIQIYLKPMVNQFSTKQRGNEENEAPSVNSISSMFSLLWKRSNSTKLNTMNPTISVIESSEQIPDTNDISTNLNPSTSSTNTLLLSKKAKKPKIRTSIPFAAVPPPVHRKSSTGALVNRKPVEKLSATWKTKGSPMPNNSYEDEYLNEEDEDEEEEEEDEDDNGDNPDFNQFNEDSFNFDDDENPCDMTGGTFDDIHSPEVNDQDHDLFTPPATCNDELNEVHTRRPMSKSKSAMKQMMESETSMTSKHKEYAALRNKPLTQPKHAPKKLTMGEEVIKLNNSLRQYESPGSIMQVTPMKFGTGQIPSKSNQKKMRASAFSPGSPDFFGSNGLKRKSKRDSNFVEGRPSYDTLTAQWEFMRTNFVNNSDEELEWLMIAKNPGAYKYASKKSQQAEDKYFKALYDIDLAEMKINFQNHLMNEIRPLLTSLCNTPLSVLQKAKSHSAEEINKPAEIVKSIKLKMDSLKSQYNTLKNSCWNNDFEIKCKDLFDEMKHNRLNKISDMLISVMEQDKKSMQQSLQAIRKESEDSLRDMEKWSKREKEVDEYPTILRKEEEDWLNKEFSANQEALSVMSSFIPANINELSVNDLMDLAKENHGLLSLELATEIKNNRLLHWIVTHEDDIALANFLTGDKKSYFENLEGLDIIELRALAMRLPTKFELDNDGKKGEWRTRLMSRVKQLVSQFNGDKVKGAWDASLGKRAMIQLPPLKPEQLRRNVYYYRTKEQSILKLKQYDDKNNILLKKQALLAKAEVTAIDTKKEYETILEESRDPDFREMYGIEKLTKAKEICKQAKIDAERSLKVLKDDVSRLQKSIESAPLTREQFQNMDDEMQLFLAEKGFNWNEKGQPLIQIVGVFPLRPEIKRIERSSAKFISAEEEAEIRKKELSNILSKGKDDVPVGLDSTMSLSDDILNGSIKLTDENSSNSVLSLINNVNNSNSSMQLEATASAFPTTPNTIRRKAGSVLELANPELLRQLNVMFSPEKNKDGSMSNFNTPGKSDGTRSRTRTPNRRGTVANCGSSFLSATAPPGALAEALAATTAGNVLKDFKKTQSSTLMKLLRSSLSPSRRSLSPKRPAMGGMGGLLEQIQMKKQLQSSSLLSNNSDNNDSIPVPPRPNMMTAFKGGNFLDELKMKANNKTKAAAVEEEQETKNDSQTQLNLNATLPASFFSSNKNNDEQSRMKPSFLASGGATGSSNDKMGSLLDAIKARRKDE